MVALNWEEAFDKAEGVVWDLKLGELLEMAPDEGVEEKIIGLAEVMSEHVTQLIIDGGWT
jgi:hypothetical protein